MPGLLGGFVGAALIDASRRDAAAQLEREVKNLAAIERARLADEQQRLALAQAEVRHSEVERDFRHAVLWLEHSNNDERFAYITRSHGPELSERVASHLMDEVRRRPEISTLVATADRARRHCDHARARWRDRDARLRALRSRCWTGAGVWLCGAIVAFVILLPFLILCGTDVVMGYVSFLAVLAIASPLIVRLQRTPAIHRSTRSGPALSSSLRRNIAHLEAAVVAAETALSTATIELTLARKALAQTFAALRPLLLTDLVRHLGVVRRQIDELQKIYPPRVRCELAAISDTALHTRLAAHLPAALDRGLARLI